MSSITIAKRNRPFSIVNKSVFEENNLSWEAMAVIAFLQQKPENWSLNVKHLIKVTKGTRKATGRDGIYAILNELKSKGYLHYKPKSTGGGDYVVYDCPEENPFFQPEAAEPLPAEPLPAEPLPAEPLPAEPLPAEPDVLIRSDQLNKKEKLINCDFSKNSKSKGKKTLLPDDFEITPIMTAWYQEQGFALEINEATGVWREYIINNKYMFPNWVDAWYRGMFLVNDKQKYSTSANSPEVALTPEQREHIQQQKKLQENIRQVKQSIAQKERDIEVFGERREQAERQGNDEMSKLNESLVDAAKNALRGLQSEYTALKAELANKVAA